MRRGRWVGIDEAGYGPNLGPLVMSYVSATGPIDSPPDVWKDLAATVCRAGDVSGRLWIDDSKAVFAQRRGLNRLEAATLAALDAASCARPTDVDRLFQCLGAGRLADVELERWIGTGTTLTVPSPSSLDFVETALSAKPFASASWQLERVRSAVLGPAGFNEQLLRTPSKAGVHFTLFARLLTEIWLSCADEVETFARCDKHGGRHFYRDLLRETFPGVQVDPVVEGPAASVYRLRDGGRSLSIEFCPRADASCGFVALASISSKWLRECWMDAFNGFWRSRVPDLKPTAGYPQDAARFRREIADAAEHEEIGAPLWWRTK